MGTPPKKSEKRSAESVAEVTISLRSFRFVATIFLRTPKRTSVLRDRSCASSIIITLGGEDTDGLGRNMEQELIVSVRDMACNYSN